MSFAVAVAVAVADMEEKLIQRLESAVCRLEALSTGFSTGSRSLGSGDDAASDPSILAFEDLMRNCVRKVSDAAEKIGGQVLEVTRIVEEAFSVEKELLVTIKQTQVIGFFLCFFFPCLNDDLMNSLIDEVVYPVYSFPWMFNHDWMLNE